MQAIREREQQLEEIREKNDRERKDIKQKFLRQNFQSNAVEKVLKGQQTDQLAENIRDFGYDDFDEADYNDDDGFGNYSANYDGQEYDGLSEQGPDSPAKPAKYQEDLNVHSIPDEELESALSHYRAMLRNNRLAISKLEQELQATSKKGGLQNESSLRDYDDDAVSQDTPFNVSDIEEASDIENSELGNRHQNQRNLGYFFENKIKDFEMRCVNGLGEQVFQQGYDFIKSKQGLSAEELRPYVTGKLCRPLNR